VSEVVMPRLSDSMEEGTIVRWLRADGERIEAGEELVEIETDKATMAFEAEASGTVRILVAEGETVPLGTPIAMVEDGVGETAAAPAGAAAAAAVAAPATPATTAAPPAPATAAAPASAPVPATASAGKGARPIASPLARRVARDLGVDLAGVTGTGFRGRIVRADVEAAAGAGVPATTATEVVSAKGATTVRELTRLQEVVARRMAESKATAPEFTLSVEVEMEAAVSLREALKREAREGERVPSYNDFVVKAAALALREFPLANGSYRDGRFELHERVNVGVAVAGEESLVVPVVLDADRKPLGTISAETRALAERAREGTISPPELAGGTFTISNLGMFGIDSFTAIINTPQAAILAVGSLAPRPVVAADGSLTSARTMSMTLSCDHRILYGAGAAEFLAAIRASLESPLRLLL
jgi:pyruvate dehydrogenase E2 component (dihydrolipoamide acetyltransferase)